MYLFKAEQKLPISLDEAWDFFSSPKNLAVITPKEMNFTITSELPEKMYEGMFISYKVAPVLGIKMNWVTEITHIVEKKFFVDEQREGPYSIWHHEHHFEEIPGGVLMKDILYYKLPFEPFGKLVGPLIRSRVNEIFQYRKHKVVDLFGAYKYPELEVEKS